VKKEVTPLPEPLYSEMSLHEGAVWKRMINVGKDICRKVLKVGDL
jgi:hypothetical protein